MTTQRTPGPWHIGPGDIYADGTAASDYDDRVICAIGQAGMRSHEYAPIKAHKPEGQANALAISLVPDMIDALRKVVTSGNAFEHAEALENAEALLTKLGEI